MDTEFFKSFKTEHMVTMPRSRRHMVFAAAVCVSLGSTTRIGFPGWVFGGQMCEQYYALGHYIYHCVQNLEHLRGNTNAISNQWPREFVVAEYHKILEVTEWLFTARGRHSGQNTRQPCTVYIAM